MKRVAREERCGSASAREQRKASTAGRPFDVVEASRGGLESPIRVCIKRCRFAAAGPDRSVFLASGEAAFVRVHRESISRPVACTKTETEEA